MARPHLPEAVEASVLTLSRRRCCVCFGLDGDISRKKGQIAHLDHDPANNAQANLAFLCLDHHDEFDSRTSQAKGLRQSEVKIYRANLYEAVAQYLKPQTPGDVLLTDNDEAEAEELFLAKER
jgi:hypothetical protein